MIRGRGEGWQGQQRRNEPRSGGTPEPGGFGPGGWQCEGVHGGTKRSHARLPAVPKCLKPGPIFPRQDRASDGATDRGKQEEHDQRENCRQRDNEAPSLR